jgi:hypothetical protein
VRLVGNLPFNVATPFLIRLLKSIDSKNNLFQFGRVPAVLTFQVSIFFCLSRGEDLFPSINTIQLQSW